MCAISHPGSGEECFGVWAARAGGADVMNRKEETCDDPGTMNFRWRQGQALKVLTSLNAQGRDRGSSRIRSGSSER